MPDDEYEDLLCLIEECEGALVYVATGPDFKMVDSVDNYRFLYYKCGCCGALARRVDSAWSGYVSPERIQKFLAPAYVIPDDAEYVEGFE
jgi:hypothetical protein